jgi:hypothetical protein
MSVEPPVVPTGRALALRFAGSLAAGALLFAGVAKAATVAIAWWRDEIPQPGIAEFLWIASLPVLVAIFLRYFSIFRPDCQACVPEASKRNGPPPSIPHNDS